MADPFPTRERHKEHSKRDGGYSGTIRSLPVHGEDSGELLGRVSIEICTACHYIVVAQCEHSVNEWKQEREPAADELEDDGKVLRCKACGIDGT